MTFQAPALPINARAVNPTQRRRGTRILGVRLAATVVAPASGAEIKWPAGPYNYIALDQDLRDALVEFGRNTGMTVKASESVRGRLRNVMPAGSAEEFLRRLCDNFGLVSYFDGSVLYVNTTAEVKTDVIALGSRMTIEEARKRLSEHGFDDPRYPLRSTADRVVSVSGPPPYLRLVRETLGPPAPKELSIPDSVMVFKGAM
jgi:type II secretory pathway component GspD/PulD (secretin)